LNYGRNYERGYNVLKLGRSFNRNYTIRLPFLDGFYDVGLFYNNKSSFLLFSVEPDFTQSKSKELSHSIKVNMFKNIESSKFCETFLDLHNYRSKNLDIVNQFKEIKPEYSLDVNFLFNETITMSKIITDNSTFYDCLNLFCFTLSSYSNEFLFLIAERQNIISKLQKKVVRSSSIQIATSPSLDLIEDFYNEARESKINNVTKRAPTDEVIKLETN
jgi:hypothetical protein